MHTYPSSDGLLCSHQSCYARHFLEHTFLFLVTEQIVAERGVKVYSPSEALSMTTSFMRLRTSFMIWSRTFGFSRIKMRVAS